jgi:ABC-type uncharacterized transport system substrate-binding protein
MSAIVITDRNAALKLAAAQKGTIHGHTAGYVARDACNVVARDACKVGVATGTYVKYVATSFISGFRAARR